MEPTMIDAEATGIILWHKAAFTLRVERSLLMLDAKSWAKWIAAKKREEAARVAGNGGIRSLAEINQQIREIDRWLITGRGTCPSTYVLHRRQLFAPPIVTAANYDVYVRRLLRLRAESATVPSSEFFFDADAQPPVLHVTEDMSAAARHVGPHVRGRVVDRREMMRLVRDGLRASGAALRLLLEQGNDGPSPPAVLHNFTGR